MTREQRIAAHVLSKNGTNAEAAKAARVSVRQVQRWKQEVAGFLDAVDGNDGMVTTVGPGGGPASISTAPEVELPELEPGEVWVGPDGRVIGSRMPASPGADETVCLTVVATEERAAEVRAALLRDERPS